jgi:hypothetical protein
VELFGCHCFVEVLMPEGMTEPKSEASRTVIPLIHKFMSTSSC